MTIDEAARQVVEAAVEWADAFPGYDAGAFGSSAYLHAREILLRATVRQYRDCCKAVADKKEDAVEAPSDISLIRIHG